LTPKTNKKQKLDGENGKLTNFINNKAEEKKVAS